MGVTGLWKLIDQSGKPVPLDTLENKILAVDISIWLHQVVKGFQDSNGATLPHAHLLGLFHRLCKLMYYRIRPVFVFDGGVPPLKRETIAKRNRNKNKYQNEADKLQHLLLEALAKEKVVQQALGASTSALLSGSPPKKAIKNTDDEDNDLFKLPPVQEELPKDDSYTDIGESDESFDEKRRVVYNHNLQAIDVKSSHFQSLPADIRHEILSDIKETRKQSSWGRLHELPAESQSFSSFQMKRLLKRRQVQVELEEAEKEMGGKGLSMAELENLLSEEGVVDPDLATERIASSDHIRYLHVRDITTALKKESDEKVKKEKLDKIKEENDAKKKKIEIIESIEAEELSDEEFDLQRAIQLSLGAPDPLGERTADGENEAVRLTVEQKKALGSTANSLARHYMIEYGGLNDDEVHDLVKIDENTQNTTQEFKFNDDSVLLGKGVSTTVVSNAAANETSFEAKEIARRLHVEGEKTIDISESSSDEAEEVSSNADSDFIDVPEMDSEMDTDDTFFMRSNFPLPPPFLMNQPPDVASANSKIEVVINPGQMGSIKDDIFADIFDEPIVDKLKKPAIEIEQKPSDECDRQEKGFADTIVDLDHLDDQDEIQMLKSPVSEANISKSSETETAVKVTDTVNVMPDSKMQSILTELDKAKSAATKLSLSDLLGPASNEMEDLTAKKDATPLDILEKEPKADGMLTPKKIPQPFFVKKTPPSSTKKSPSAAKNGTDVTPSKVAKSLADAFDSIPSTSATAIDEKQSIAMAANVLRENKSKEELEDIADMLNQERRDLAAERNKKDRLGVSITEQMSMECMELLQLFGVPYVIAPMEAEAQCAYLNAIELTDGTITDDSDIWLFGGQTVYKNFFDQNKHVLEFRSENIERLFHLDRHKLIQLSFLVGSDYTEGIHGIGAVTALEVLSIFTATPEKDGETTQIMSILSSLRKFREWWANKSVAQRANALRNKLKNITISEEFPNARVVEAYLFPTVDENRESFSWGKLEVESIREYAKKTFGWTNKRTDEIILPVVKRLSEKTSQQSIQNYFKVTGVTSRKDLQVSKRVRAALQQMSGEPDPSMDADDAVVEKKKAKKRTTKKKTQTDGADDTPTADNVDLEIVEEPGKQKANSKAEAKPRRKRKAQKETEQAADNGCSDPEAGTSTAAGPKKIVLPENPLTTPIPQREKDKQLMQSNRLKAAELLKKAKMSQKR